MKCPEKRVCIEEMAPTVCLHHKCRRHLRSRCVPSPQLSPPSECHQVSCPNGTVCHVLHTKSGRHAHCVKNKPSSCVELGPCEPGMVCKVRRGREHSIAHCVAKHSSINPKPQDCSQVKCQKGFECAIFGGKHVRPRCVHQKPLPKTCMDLDCQAINMSCHETVKGPECFVASQCKELACGKDQYCSLKTLSWPKSNCSRVCTAKRSKLWHSLKWVLYWKSCMPGYQSGEPVLRQLSVSTDRLLQLFLHFPHTNLYYLTRASLTRCWCEFSLSTISLCLVPSTRHQLLLKWLGCLSH